MSTAKPRFVIVAAGFGGLAAARPLARAPVEIVVLDHRNYQLFQPLPGWRSRLVVGLNWLWIYVNFERGARLITAPDQESHQTQAPSPRVAA